MNLKHTNQHIAQFMLGKKLLNKEQIKHYLSIAPPGKNLGQILLVQGVITNDQYVWLMAHIKKIAATEPPKEEFKLDFQENQVEETPAAIPLAEEDPTPADPVTQSEEELIEKTPKQSLTKNLNPTLPSIFRFDKRQAKEIALPSSLSKNSRMEEILIYARKANVSDVHLSPNSPIRMRRFGKLERACRDLFTANDILNIIRPILDEDQMNELTQTGDLEFAYAIPGYGRYRMTMSEQRNGFDITCRIIDAKVRSFESSGLPEQVQELTHWAQGLVLVTGPLGCGKTSTLATLVDLVNRSRDEHIITVENPIEIVYPQSRCQISQREVGRHTLSPVNALKGALRQDPDILVVSELRDLESIRLAVSAAETGHLVFGTMNTNNAVRTIDRLIESFPPNEQEITRGMVSETLRGIISQQLIPKADGRGLVAAYEILVVTKAVSNLIRKNNTHVIPTSMISGKSQGMRLLDDHLAELVNDGTIDGKEAWFRASNPKTFKSYAPAEIRDMLDE